jgi:hypothetical protein
MSPNDARQLISDTLTASVSTLKIERNQSELSVQEVNIAFPSLHTRFNELYKLYLPNASVREREALRKKIYVEAGISDGRPETFNGMPFTAVIQYIEEKSINTISGLPSKLNEWISSQPGWKDQLLQSIPMKAYSISKNKQACRSKYELILANIFSELLPDGITVSSQNPYPFDAQLNHARQPLTCDFVVQMEKSVWIELFLYRVDSKFKEGTGIASARSSYLKRRQQKVDLLNSQRPGDQFISIDISTVTGQSKSFRQFIKNVLFELTPILHLKPVDIYNEALFTSFIAVVCAENSPMSQENQNLMTSLLTKASQSFEISTEKLKTIHDLMVSGISAKAALDIQAIPADTLLGLSRLTTDASWQLRRTLPSIMNEHIPDGKFGKGSSLLSFAKAINHLVLVKIRNEVLTELQPKWVQHFCEKNSEIGQLGVFSMNFRKAIPYVSGKKEPRNYAYFSVQWQKDSYFYGAKDILQSHTKGIEQAARLFIARLLLIMESRLILNWEAPGSTMLIPGRFILSNPNPAQVDNVVEHVVARAK